MTDGDDERARLRAEVERLRAAHVELEGRATRAEEELRASRAIHEALIESLPFDFWARDRDGYCFSQNATTRTNWPGLLGKRPEDMPLPPSVVEAWLANNRRALAGETVSGENTYELAGKTTHVQNVLAPIRMGNEIVGTLGVNIDITDRVRADEERVRALEALRESEEKLRLAVQAAGIGLWSWDFRTDKVSWDERLCAIFGLAPESAPKTRHEYIALLHPEDREHSAARIARGLEEGWWEDEFRIVRGDGTTRWVMSHGSAMRVNGREGVVGVVVDVTERRERDDRLRQAQKLEAVGQLTAGIAHNFNNMLMGILPNLELASRSAPPRILPYLESARESAQRAAELVRQLTTFAGRSRRKERSVEALAPLVERSVELCRTTFDHRIAFVTHFDDAARARVDAGQIQQAILNLLINARDALDGCDADTPRVTIEVGVVRADAAELEGRTGDYARVRIGDNGVGMAGPTLARLYEPFFTTKDVGKGTGLGLATTHAILREHGGFIACASTPGLGTTFSVYLPSESGRPDAPRPTQAASTARGTETVLLVDDEPAVRSAVCALVGDAGFDVRATGSGDEALALLADPRFAADVRVVLLDVSMPGMPSSVLRSRLRELAPRARVVYFTGYAFEAPDAEDAVLEKPVTRERLLATLREVLDRR